MSIPEEAIKQLHEVAVEMKEHTWRDHGIRDLQPHGWIVLDEGMLDLELEAMQDAMEGLGSLFDPDKTPPALQVAVSKFTPEAPQVLRLCMTRAMTGQGHAPSGSKLEAVIIHADTLVREYAQEDKALAETTQRGDLARDLATNPDSTVREAMMTQVFESDLVGGVTGTSIVQKYKLCDGGQLHWDEPDYVVNEDPQGAIPDAVREWFQLDRMEVK